MIAVDELVLSQADSRKFQIFITRSETKLARKPSSKVAANIARGSVRPRYGPETSHSANQSWSTTTLHDQ